MARIRPSKESIELSDFETFIRLSGIFPPQFQYEGPRKTFPDFIITSDGKTINIEITRAPSNRRMEGISIKRNFEEFIYPILQDLKIEADLMEQDGPKLLSTDAYKYRKQIADWVSEKHDTIPIKRQIIDDIFDIQNLITKQFGNCIVKLECRNGKKKFGYYWEQGNPYNLCEASMKKFYGNIARNAISAIKQKLKKYGRQGVFTDLFIIKPVYWEPINTKNEEEMSKLREIIRQEISAHHTNERSLIELIPQHFGEIWILMPYSTFLIFPM